MVTPGNAPAGWYPDPDDHGRARFWDGSAWSARAGSYPDPERPGSKRTWNGSAWEGPSRPPVEPRVVRAFAAMTVSGVVAVVVGYLLVRPVLSGSGTAPCDWDGQDATHEAFRACRRAACDQLRDQIPSSAAVAVIPWLVLLALAIAASWLGWTEVRHRTGRIRYALIAALVAAWFAVVALIPGLPALLAVLGDCTT